VVLSVWRLQVPVTARVLLFAGHYKSQSPRHSRQHRRPSTPVAQSFRWLGSPPCRCNLARGCSSTRWRLDRNSGVPTDDRGPHPVSPMVSCMTASRPLSLPQRRRFQTKWARHNTQERCSGRPGTGRSPADACPRFVSFLTVDQASCAPMSRAIPALGNHLAKESRGRSCEIASAPRA
jgi:hypothetical protein